MTREEKLILLMEEAAEVIQAASKCLRFGWLRDHPGYGVNNEVLAHEVGELLGVVMSLGLDPDIMREARTWKMDRAEKIKYELS